MRVLSVLLLAALAARAGCLQGKVALPFKWFLLQQPAFEVEETSNSLPTISSVPLVMRMLFEEAERVSNRESLPEGGDFQSLARSFRPTDIEEVGLQRVILTFPDLEHQDLVPGGEAWLVFLLRQSYYNCSQVLTVYENTEESVNPVVTVPYSNKNGDPLLMVNITRSLSEWKDNPVSYVVVIKDGTKYTRDEHLYSFSNYIDCSLARACEVLELHDEQSSPVLLVLSPELATMNLLAPQNRYRRYVVDSKEEDLAMDEGTEGRLVGNCHLMEWSVNIEQLGWDWLVYPERIPLNLCVGTCPELLDRHFNATSHAVARGLYRLVLGQESKPENTRPSCVPVKYRRFTMLIEKSPGIISLETSADLSAAQCGCR